MIEYITLYFFLLLIALILILWFLKNYKHQVLSFIYKKNVWYNVEKAKCIMRCEIRKIFFLNVGLYKASSFYLKKFFFKCFYILISLFDKILKIFNKKK